MTPEDTAEMFKELDSITEGTGLNVKPIDISPTTYERNGDSLTFDERLDAIDYAITMRSYRKPNETITTEMRLKLEARAKQAIKQLIASELGAIIDANIDENGTDSDRVWEVLMEWMGELQQ